MQSDSNKFELLHHKRFLNRVEGHDVDIIAGYEYIHIEIEDVSLEYKQVLCLEIDIDSVLVLDLELDTISMLNDYLQRTSFDRVRNQIEYTLNK